MPAALRELVLLQEALVRRLAQVVGVPVTRLSRHLAPLARGGFELAGERWIWQQRGAGVRFEGESGRVVEVPQRLQDTRALDARRLAVFSASGTEVDWAEELRARCAGGELVQVALAWAPPRYRLPEHTYLPEHPWMTTGRKQGGWIELQPGRFDDTHWHEDSVYLDLFEHTMASAFEQLIPDYDPFEFYEERSVQTGWKLAHLLRLAGLEVLDAAELPAAEASARHDACWDLADWLESVVVEHETFSILGV